MDNKTKILKIVQEGIPIEKELFKVISEKTDIGEDAVIKIIRDLKERKIIRRLSPIYDTVMLGYDSALVAFKVNHHNIEHIASIVSAHPGVSHNYEREHEFNLWFTLAVPPDSMLSLDRTVELLADKANAGEFSILRRKKVFKIGVKLGFDLNYLEKEKIKKKNHCYTTHLTEEEKRIIKITQSDIPLTKRPFSIAANTLGIDENVVIEKLKEFMERGIMRRFAAILNHRRAGFLANGMLVSMISENRVEEVGYKIASFKAVSHCYERRSKPARFYNMFSMIHGRSRDEVELIVKEIVKDLGLKNYEVIYSGKEYKKRRIKYFTDDLYQWEFMQFKHNLLNGFGFQGGEKLSLEAYGYDQ